MIKVHKVEGKNFVKISENLYPAIVDKNSDRVFVFYQEKFILHLTLEGRCLKKEPVSAHVVNYMSWNTGICWQPSHYVNNKRSCGGCEHIRYCQCDLHTEKFNFGAKENDSRKEERAGTELSNDCNENATHEPETPTTVQEQPPESGLVGVST